MADEPITIDTTEWTKKMTLFAAATGKNMREALYEEWPLLVRKVMDFTPPFEAGSGKSDLSIGRAAVNRDIRKTMRPFNPAAKTKVMEKILDEKNIALFNLIAARVKTGPMANARAVPFSPQVHTSQRNSRGRVGKGLGNVVIGSDVGLFKKYLKTVQDRVGWAKAGWLRALNLVGGNAPAYVMKHGMSGGDVIDNHADEEDPSITGINRTPWAERRDEGQRIVQAAYKSRAEAIFSKTKVKLRLAIKEARLDNAA